jgi:signal transduction histidine kinase
MEKSTSSHAHRTDDLDGGHGGDGKSSARSSKSANRETQHKLLSTLEQLLALDGLHVKSTLDAATDRIAVALRADKVDAFVYDPSKETLVALGTSHTPMGIRQHQIGLHLLPIANGGPEAAIFVEGGHYHTGHAEQDPTIPPGMTRVLGVRSMLIVPLDVNSERRGVLQACSTQQDAFSEDDLTFLEAVSHWVGALTHRAELTERITQDAAAQARRVVAEELIMVLAHDLRHYLTPLKGWLGIVLERARRDNRTTDVTAMTTAARAVDRLEALIRDLLDVGRLDQGLFSVSRQPVDLIALVRDSIGILGSTGSTQPGQDGQTDQTDKVDILLRVPDELIAQVDPPRLRQALENLVSNALKHSPKGVPVVVEVESEKRLRADGPGEESWACISVKDQGPGISAEMLPRLFTRFASGPNSQGLGLGLYLARSIAEAHGGTLTVESNPEEGTTFQLCLPTVA